MLGPRLFGWQGRAEGGLSVLAAVYAWWEPFLAWGLILRLLQRCRQRVATLGPLGRRMAQRAFAVFVIHPPVVVAVSLAWRGVDGVLKSRDAGVESVDRTMLLATLMSQWETDLQAVQGDAGVPALSFDGRALRLVRRADAGLQLVVWSLNSGVWQRWTSQPSTRVGDLQQAWLRSQQLQGQEPEQLRLLENVSDWQI